MLGWFLFYQEPFYPWSDNGTDLFISVPCGPDPKPKAAIDPASCQRAQRKEKSGYACEEKGAE